MDKITQGSGDHDEGSTNQQNHGQQVLAEKVYS